MKLYATPMMMMNVQEKIGESPRSVRTLVIVQKEVGEISSEVACVIL